MHCLKIYLPSLQNKESVRTQPMSVCYGLHDKSWAGEYPLRRLLSTGYKSGDSLARFVEKPHFISVLIDILGKRSDNGVT